LGNAPSTKNSQSKVGVAGIFRQLFKFLLHKFGKQILVFTLVLKSQQAFTDWIKNKIEKYGFIEGEDFYSILSKTPEGGRPATEYLLTIDMGKELAMVENNEKGRQVRKYFIECERRAKELLNVTVIKSNNILDLQKKRLDIMDGNTRIRRAKALLTGHDLPAMLPASTEKFYNNSDLGTEMGVSNRKVMKLGRSLKLVAPEGQSNVYGAWKMTKSPHSPHECSQCYWTALGRQKVINSHQKLIITKFWR
jgi:phage anti-repressor protein